MTRSLERKKAMALPASYANKDDGYYGYARSELIRFVPEDAKRLLDVGCAAGKFGAGVLQQRPGIEIWGIEPMPEFAIVARTKLHHVICSGVEEAIDALPDGYFDCISFNDVLEHLQDPWRILKQMKLKLAAGGRVVASIPNLRYFPVVASLVLRGDFHYLTDGVMDITHLRFFTRKSMARLFADCGYDITEMVGLRWEKFPFFLNVVNRICGRPFEDMHYVQFAIQARPA